MKETMVISILTLVAVFGLLFVVFTRTSEWLSLEKQALNLRAHEVCSQLSRIQWIDANEATVSDPVQSVYQKCLTENGF